MITVIELDALARQVLTNCSISDARHAGLYSVCGLALRLRDLYKWEKGLKPWEERESSEVLEWIGDKEESWDGLADRQFEHITMGGRSYDPFDVESINRVLEPQGVHYGAGYARGMRPSFFLARVVEKKHVLGHGVVMLGQELARDLLTIPALTQNGTVLIRKESGKLFLWDQMLFVNKSTRPALRVALRTYGIEGTDPKTLKGRLEEIFDSEVDTYVRHELGEIHDTFFDRETWAEIIAAFPHTAIELLVRAVKDLLADTNEWGRLPYVTARRKTASLAFYVAFLNGITKYLCPDIFGAFARFASTEDWSVISQAISFCRERSKRYADEMSSIFRKGKEKGDLKWVEGETKERLLAPLGVHIP